MTTTTRKPTTRKAATPKPAAAKKAEPRTSTTAARNATVRTDGIPTGYVNRWPHAGYDNLLKTDPTVEGPKWYVRCNEHGQLHACEDVKECDRMGRKADRAAWCKGCKAAVAKPERTSKGGKATDLPNAAELKARAERGTAARKAVGRTLAAEVAAKKARTIEANARKATRKPVAR